MKGLDLSKLKKIASDKHTTTFKHADGHELRIAHSGLSPKMREEMEKLPIHKADGGDATPNPQPNQEPDDDSSTQTPATPGVNININAQPNQPTPQPSPQPNVSPNPAPAPQAPANIPVPAQYVPGVSDPGPVATTGNNPNAPGPEVPPTDQGDGAPQAPAQGQAPVKDLDDQSPAPIANGQSTATVADVAPMVKQQLSTEDQAWANDLANGHITPETYGSLFAKKDTLGKIGTIFGMLLSGAGSGLSHQPNALLGLMNQQIQNDLEAQKQSKTNAQNFLKLNNEHQVQLAQVGELGAQTKNLTAEANNKAYALSNMQMNRAVVHKLSQQVASLPVGSPQRAQAEQTLAMVAQAVNTENYSISDQAAAQAARLKAMGINMAGEPTGGSAGAQNTSSTNPIAAQLRKMAALGYVDKETQTAAQKELAMIQNKNQANQSALDSFDKVAQMNTVGNRGLNPIQSGKQIGAEWDPMLDRLTKSNEGRVTPITVDMMNGIKPTVLDDAQTTAIKRQKLNEILNSGFATPTLDSLNLTPSKSTPNSTPTMMSKSGRPMIQVNGKWHYAK